MVWTSSCLAPRYNWPFSAESTSEPRSLLPKRCSFLLKRRQGGRFGSSAHLRFERPACTFKATALWASACSGGLAVQSTKVRRSQVQSEEANLQSHAAEAQAGAVCRDSLLLACPPSTSSRVHSPGWATNEGGLPAGQQELLHFALSPRVSPGPYQCTQQATNLFYTAGRCTLQTPPVARVHSPRTKCRSIKGRPAQSIEVDQAKLLRVLQTPL